MSFGKKTQGRMKFETIKPDNQKLKKGDIFVREGGILILYIEDEKAKNAKGTIEAQFIYKNNSSLQMRNLSSYPTPAHNTLYRKAK